MTPVMGLTFGEILIVVSVFLIMAIMFLLTSQQAIVKSKHSATLQGLNSLEGNLKLHWSFTSNLPTQNEGLERLTTGAAPVISKVPSDPFADSAAESREIQYYYNVGANQQFLLVSVGPDGVSDVRRDLEHRKAGSSLASGDSSSPWVRMSSQDLKEFVNAHQYDPTNGVTSAGDVIRRVNPFGSR